MKSKCDDPLKKKEREELLSYGRTTNMYWSTTRLVDLLELDNLQCDDEDVYEPTSQETSLEKRQRDWANNWPRILLELLLRALEQHRTSSVVLLYFASFALHVVS